MISAVNEQFSKFVQFAEDQSARGKDKAIATKGDVAINGGTTLEERSIVRTNRTDWVGLVFFRSGDTRAVNNEVRALFRKTIADMFGGEQNIPDSVKEAMLMKDYGCGKPLTARRIIAVRDAIVDLGRVNCFDKTNDPDGELAKKAIANGYTRLDFGKLNTAANLLCATNGIGYKAAMEQVITQGSAANRTMNAGSLYMKNATIFSRGLGYYTRIAGDDARNIEVAKLAASKESVANLSEIADNLAYKFNNILHDAEDLLRAAKLPPETLAGLRTAVDEVADKFTGVSADIATGALKSREEVYKRLFLVSLKGVSDEVQAIFTSLGAAAAQNPAVEEFRQYLREYFKEVGEYCDKLAGTYRLAVASDMAKDVEPRLIAAAQKGGQDNGSPSDIPALILDNITNFLAVNPFENIENVEKFIGHLENSGSANLRFTAEQKTELKAMVDKAFGEGPKADKILKRLVEQFEASFYAEQLNAPTDFGKNPPTGPSFIVNYFKNNPEALGVFDPGFKLDTKEDVDAVKTSIKEKMLADLNAKLNDPDTSKVTSLSSGLFPQGVREYHSGYVTFNGELIPNAEYGTKFPQLGAGCNIPERKGYAEFLEKTFDANHKKMRQTVSFVCGMADGLAGTIDSMIDHGDNCIKGAPRDKLIQDHGMGLSAGELSPEDNYNIERVDNGDLKITLTHLVKNHVSYFINVNDGTMYNSKLVSTPNACTILSNTKFVVTMTIKNVADADLGPNDMPEFAIDDIKQEQL